MKIENIKENRNERKANKIKLEKVIIDIVMNLNPLLLN